MIPRVTNTGQYFGHQRLGESVRDALTSRFCEVLIPDYFGQYTVG